MARAVLEDISKWLVQVTMITRQPEEAYQLVCDYYQGYTESLEPYARENAPAGEREAVQPVITVLSSGFNTCSLWVTSSKCMEHFRLLSRTIRASMDKLDRIKTPEETNQHFTED